MNKSHVIFVACAAGAALIHLALTAGAQQSPMTTQPGRFTLQAVKMTVIIETGPYETNALARIDTQTGETSFMLAPIVKDGAAVAKWNVVR